MNWIILEGVKPYDGRYEIHAADLTTVEWGWIKRLTGYLPLTIEEGFDGHDPELFVVLACIALRRAGRVDAGQVPDVFKRIADAPFAGTIRLESDTADQEEGEGDAGPPPPSSEGNSSASGPDSTRSSETSPPTPSGSGTPASDTSESPPIRLAT